MQKIIVDITVSADVQEAWKHWNNPESIKGWAFASDDWECLYAENDLKVGGKFITTMSAKDQSTSFDFTGTYTEIIPLEKISYNMDKVFGVQNERTCTVTFTSVENFGTKITEEFDPEDINPIEMQQSGWQAILENFKKFVEKN